MGLWDKVTFNGKRVTRLDRDLLQEAARAVGFDPKKIVLAQGSWNLGGLSAGTHAGSGAWDIDLSNFPAALQIPMVVECRKRGAGSTFIRSAKYGWTQSGAHIHGVHGCGDAGDDPYMSDPAKRQVVLWVKGYDGLKGFNKDPFPRPKIWPRVSWSVVGLGKKNASVTLVQGALKRYCSPDLVVDGYWGPKTQASWLKACVKTGRTGINLLSLLGNRYGFRPDN